jgi:hypothetical protein
MRMLTQLRVDEIAKFLGYFGVAGADNTVEILLKLFGFKNAVVTQQSALSGDELLPNPS